MGDPATIAKQFTDFYYTTFDQNRANLAPLYREGSMLSWETKQIAGVNGIVQHLTELPFQKVLHRVSSLDAQPSNPPTANLLVLVTGQLLVDDGENPLPFSQVFQLIPDGSGSYYVQNDVFRLVYG